MDGGAGRPVEWMGAPPLPAASCPAARARQRLIQSAEAASARVPRRGRRLRSRPNVSTCRLALPKASRLTIVPCSAAATSGAGDSAAIGAGEEALHGGHNAAIQWNRAQSRLAAAAASVASASVASASVKSGSGMLRKTVAEAPVAPVVLESVPVMLRKPVVEAPVAPVPVVPVTAKEAVSAKKAEWTIDRSVVISVVVSVAVFGIGRARRQQKASSHQNWSSPYQYSTSPRRVP